MLPTSTTATIFTALRETFNPKKVGERLEKTKMPTTTTTPLSSTSSVGSPSSNNLSGSGVTNLRKATITMIASIGILLILLAIVLIKMFQRKRRYSGKVLVSPQLDFLQDSTQPQAVNFTILRRKKPINRSTGKGSLANKLHGALAVKVESTYPVQSSEQADSAPVKLTELVVFDIELIFNGNIWQVVIAPSAPSDPDKLDKPGENSNTLDVLDEHLDWNQGTRLSPNWRLEDFSSVARLVGEERGDYCVVTNNCLHFRNAVYRKICTADYLFK